MTLFVDASALVAIIAGENEAAAFADRLEAAQFRLCSALSIWETVASLCSSYKLSVISARAQVQYFVDAGEFLFVPIGKSEYDIAADAYARFGKGRHPAGLNMGDCFAYACAKTNNAKLLYKGNDFARTDLA